MSKFAVMVFDFCVLSHKLYSALWFSAIQSKDFSQCCEATLKDQMMNGSNEKHNFVNTLRVFVIVSYKKQKHMFKISVLRHDTLTENVAGCLTNARNSTAVWIVSENCIAHGSSFYSIILNV